MKRMTELVIDDVGQPAGVLALAVSAKEVDLVTGRERVAAASLVYVEQQARVQPGRGCRIDDQIARDDLAAVDERRELRVADLIGREVPRHGCSDLRGKRRGHESVVIVLEGYECAGEPRHDARRNGA